MSWLGRAAYAAYICVFIVGIPVFAWFVLLPAHNVPAFYWSSLVIDCLVNSVTILSGLVLLIHVLARAALRRRQRVWDPIHNRWRQKYEATVEAILQSCPAAYHSPSSGAVAVIRRPALTSSPTAVGEGKTSGAEAKSVEVGPPLPRALVIITSAADTDPVMLAGCLEAVGLMRYSGNLEVILVIGSPTALTELPPHLIDAQVNYLDRYGRPLTVLVDVDPLVAPAIQINVALDAVRDRPPAYVMLLKAHQRPDRHALLIGVGLAEGRGADLVQGRAIVLNNDVGLWPRLRAVAADSDYVLPTDDEEMRGLGFMGGTSAFWRYTTLVTLGLEVGLVHPAIDAGFRAVRAGYKIVSSPSLCTYELVPETFVGWFRAYVTFSQGWFQLTLRHWRGVMACTHLSRWSRFGFMLLLIEREICSYVATQMLPVTAASIIYYSYKHDMLLLGTTVVALAIRPLHLLLVRLYLHLDLDAEPPTKDYRPVGLSSILLYLVLFPLSSVLQFVITAAAHLRVLSM